MLKTIRHWVWYSFVLAVSVAAQNEAGLPIVHNFSPKEYGGAMDNWCIVQDGRGLIYVANGAGVLEYDGSSWRIIPVENQAIVRWLTKDRDGTIYVATQGDLGRLEPDAAGRMKFVSLLGARQRDSVKMGDLWEVEATSGGIYARSYDRIFRWRDGILTSWSSERFDMINVVQDTVYSRIRGKGVVMITGDSLIPAPGGDKFDLKINAVFPYEGKRMFATRKDGLFLYDGKAFKPFPTDQDDYLKKNQIYHGIALQDGRLVFATLHGGIVLFDHFGKLEKILSRFSEVQDDNAKAVFQDRDGALWIALGNGVSRTDVTSSISAFDERLGVSGHVNALRRYRNALYAITSQGILKLGTAGGGESRFDLIEMEKISYETAILYDDKLFASGANGIRILKGHTTTDIKMSATSALLTMNNAPNRILTASQTGLYWIFKDPVSGVWKAGAPIGTVPEYISNMAQDSHGFVWAGTWFQGVLRIDLSKGYSDHPTAERFGPAQGVPEGYTEIFLHDNTCYVSSEAGILHYLPNDKKFIPVNKFLDSLKSPSSELNLVINRNQGLIYASYLEEGFTGARAMIDKLWQTGENQPATYFKDSDGVEWFGGHYRIIRNESKGAVRPAQNLIALIRRVSIGMDSVLFGGSHQNKETVTLPYDPSGIRFEYTSLQFDKSDLHVYQYQLEGLETSWSHWASQQNKEYSNLPEGRYRFRVRAMDAMGQVSSEDGFSFTILPPWQRTWWAYTLYILLFAAIVYSGTKLRLKQLQRQNEDLESSVEKRTRELETALKDLKDTEMQLVQSEKLASVGHLVAGIAHEINNPLTFIIPNLEYIKAHLQNIPQDVNPNEAMQAIESSIHGGKRIREVVNNLRTFTRIDSDAVIDADIEMHLDFAVDLFVQHNTDIRIEKRYGLKQPLRVNIQELNQCFINILTNATQAIRDAESKNALPRGEGRITITTEHLGAQTRITISDNGIGIPKDVLPKIFEPFFTTRSIGQGRGLGLSETYAIIKKHLGTTQVLSESGKGTQIVITLPVRS